MKKIIGGLWLGLCIISVGIFFGSCKKAPEINGIGDAFGYTEGTYQTLVKYAESALKVYELTEAADGALTLQVFQTKAGLSQDEITDAVTALLGVSDIRKLKDYEKNRRLFAYYHIDDITDYYFWIHAADLTGAYLDIVKEAYHENASMADAANETQLVRQRISAWNDAEQAAVGDYLDAFEKLSVFCENPGDYQIGEDALAALKTTRDAFAEATKASYMNTLVG